MDVMMPKFNQVTITGSQNARNIAKIIKRSIFESSSAANHIAHKFKGGNKYLSCFNVYIYLRKNIKYIREGSNLQTAKTLQRILFDKYGDCKHYTTFACSILKALGIDCQMRLISQDFYDPNPTHIYCVAKINGQDVIVDPCMKTFDSEAQYKYKYNLKLK